MTTKLEPLIEHKQLTYPFHIQDNTPHLTSFKCHFNHYLIINEYLLLERGHKC